MSDSYQPIYDAVRSRISGGNIGEVVSEAARNAFDISYVIPLATQAIGLIENELTRPSTRMRPSLSIDGNKWCALYGDNLQDGVAGFGDSPEEAFWDFDKAWHAKLPQAIAAATHPELK